MTAPKIVITPRRAALLAGHNNELDVLVRIQAPEVRPEQSERNPLHLSLVIDRSGSMSGQPLAEAKRCAEFVLDGLMAHDRLSVVAYDSAVHTLAPAALLHDKEKVRRAIRGICEGGTTNLHGGWLKGAETLAAHTDDSITSRVILLSDGCANVGLTDGGPIFEQCADLARAGVSTSTYGLGRSFNEDLMIGMAKHGQGSSYYGQTAEDLMDPFREEFELLNALFARRVRFEVDLAPSVKGKMLNDYAIADAKIANIWLLPNLAYAGEAWAVLRLSVSKDLLAKLSPKSVADASAEGAVPLLSISVHYSTVDGESQTLKSESLALETLPASAFGAIAEDELVVRRVGELEAAEFQQRARTCARQHDWVGVEKALKKAEKAAANNPWVADSLDELRDLAAMKDQEMFSKEAMFASRRMSTRLAESRESVADYELPAAASYLRRKKSQGRGNKTRN